MLESALKTNSQIHIPQTYGDYGAMDPLEPGYPLQYLIPLINSATVDRGPISTWTHSAIYGASYPLWKAFNRIGGSASSTNGYLSSGTSASINATIYFGRPLKIRAFRFQGLRSGTWTCGPVRMYVQYPGDDAWHQVYYRASNSDHLVSLLIPIPVENRQPITAFRIQKANTSNFLSFSRLDFLG